MFAKNLIGKSEASNELTITTDEAGQNFALNKILGCCPAGKASDIGGGWGVGALPFMLED